MKYLLILWVVISPNHNEIRTYPHKSLQNCEKQYEEILEAMQTKSWQFTLGCQDWSKLKNMEK